MHFHRLQSTLWPFAWPSVIPVYKNSTNKFWQKIWQNQKNLVLGLQTVHHCEMGVGVSKKESVSTSMYRERARAAILGGFVADAATMPMHWIYDRTVIDALLKESKSVPEFFNPSCSKFYTYETGRLSPYGDEALPVFVCTSTEGFVDLDLCRNEIYNFYKSYDGRLNRSSKRFRELRDSGLSWSDCTQVDDIQFSVISKVPIIVARYCGSPIMLDKLDSIVCITQDNSKVRFAAKLFGRLLEKVILGSTINDSLSWAYHSIEVTEEEKSYICELDQVCRDNTNRPFSVVVESIGLNGNLPAVLVASLYNLRVFKSYESAIRANIIAGGDNVCRSWMIGTLIAAEQGINVIPNTWIAKTTLYDELLALTNRVVGSNPFFDTLQENKCSLKILAK